MMAYSITLFGLRVFDLDQLGREASRPTSNLHDGIVPVSLFLSTGQSCRTMTWVPTPTRL